MTQRTAATRYARALFDVALTEGADLVRIEADLNGFVSLIRGNDGLEKALFNPSVPAPRKRGVVEAIMELSPTVAVLGKLLVVLADRDRLPLLPELLEAYRRRLLDHQHVVRADITTATPLGAERAGEIERSLAHATGRTIRMSTQVDPAIVGGLVAKIGGTVYDASITAQLRRMKQRLEESL